MNNAGSMWQFARYGLSTGWYWGTDGFLLTHRPVSSMLIVLWLDVRAMSSLIFPTT